MMRNLKLNYVKLNYAVDIISAVLFVIVFITGVIKLPGLRLHRLGFNMVSATFMHDWAGILLGVFILIHFILHWRWIYAITKSFIGKGEKK